MKKTIKVVSLFESLKIGGGVEKIQANLSIGLTDLGYEFIHLILEDKNPRNEHKGKIVSLGEEFIFGFGIKKIISLFKIAWKVKEYCNKEKVDIVIGQGDFFFMVSGLSKIMGNKSKSIAVVHTSIGVWNSFINRILRFFLSYHDHIVMTSKYEMDTFITKYKYDCDHISLIYNAIDIEAVLANGIEDIPDPYRHLFVNGRQTFINIARLNYQKNQQLLIKAFAGLGYDNIQLVIVGEGDERNSLEKLIKKLGLESKVFLVGNQINPHTFVAHSDYRVLSSRFEGFPVVFSEGGLFKKSMIAMDCPTGPREFLSPERELGGIDGFALVDNGILVSFDENDSANLTKAMEYVLCNDLTQQKTSVYNYCLQFDNVVNAEKRDHLIQSLNH